MTLPSRWRSRFEDSFSKCMHNASVCNTLALSIALMAMGCGDTIEDGVMLEPTPEQQAVLASHENATLAFFKEKKNFKNVTNASTKSKTIRRIARAS